MNKFQPTLEHALYAVALAIAAGLRFLHLGAQPLSDFEAGWALQALHIVQGLHPAIGTNPAYVHLTAALFFVFGTTNFLARFWPALAGCALVLLPWSLRGRVGRLPALILAFGLAIDPGLVAMSHLAGGPMLAILFVAMATLAWMERRLPLAGVCAGLALLSGPSAWLGILVLALVGVISMTVGKRFFPPAEMPADSDAAKPFAWSDVRLPLLWAAGTWLVVGSLLLVSPKGLEGLGTGLFAFLRGWWSPSGTPVWQPLLALPAYEILPLAFGIAGLVRGWMNRESLSFRLGVWALVALALALLYPGRQTGDLAWALLPLWALAGIELSHHFDFAGRNLWEVAATATLIVAILVFGWLNLANLTNMDLTGQLARTRLYLLMAVIVLIVLSLLLVWTGWSSSVARLGGVWAFVLTLTAFTLAMATGAAAIREPLTAELWQPEPRSGPVDLIAKVANQISELNRGVADQLALTILTENSPALHWVFRDWKTQDVNELAPDAAPELIITPPGDISLAVKYRGEGLVLHETPAWDKAATADWLKWFVYRQMPIDRENVVLWVRSDLMLDNQDTAPSP